MKMGWKEGEGLGSESQGIKAPVNKYAHVSEQAKTQSLSSLSPFHIFLFLSSFFLIPPSLSHISLSRGVTASNGAGFGIDRPAELTKADDEYDAFRKRMMLAYRFRPNPLVRPGSTQQAEFSPVPSKKPCETKRLVLSPGSSYIGVVMWSLLVKEHAKSKSK